VVVAGTASSGTVLAIDAKTDHATIDVNGIKFRVKRSQLQKTSHASGASASSQPQREYRRGDSPGVVGHVIADASTTLDLRGMRADECVRALEHFLDTALLRHLPFATIIHGKGTGALRKVVHDYLADYHGTTGYRTGKIEEGGDGVTIVEF
jgi:DNA mismatch repair protein MutS2